MMIIPEKDVADLAILSSKNLEGWCVPEKAAELVHFAYKPDVLTCVEIGVFGGKSLIPVATALKIKGQGIAYGVESYSNADTLKDVPEGNHLEWWRSIDLQKIKAGFLDAVNKLQLNNYVKLLEMASFEAVSKFERHSIDLLHIDGNHTEKIALTDVINWLPKLRPGGYLFLDDISWEYKTYKRATTAAAIEYALNHCHWLGIVDQTLICQKYPRVTR